MAPFRILLVRLKIIVDMLFISSNQVVDALSTASNVRPAVHHANLFMEAVSANNSTLLVLSHQQTNSFAGCTHEIIFFGFGKHCHVAREYLWDAADSGAYDEQVAASSFYQDGSKSLSQAGMQVYVTSNHDVANFFMTHRAQKGYSIVEDMAVKHLLEIDCFWTRTSNYETHVGMRSENARDRSNEQIGPFVVEKTRNNDDGDGIIRAKRLRGLRRRGRQSGAHRRLGGILWV